MGLKSRARVLSAQERRVSALVADGFTNQQIGYAMGLSVKTVEGYRARAMRKTRSVDRAGLVAWVRGRRALDGGQVP